MRGRETKAAKGAVNPVREPAPLKPGGAVQICRQAQLQLCKCRLGWSQDKSRLTHLLCQHEGCHYSSTPSRTARTTHYPSLRKTNLVQGRRLTVLCRLQLPWSSSGQSTRRRGEDAFFVAIFLQMTRTSASPIFGQEWWCVLSRDFHKPHVHRLPVDFYTIHLLHSLLCITGFCKSKRCISKTAEQRPRTFVNDQLQLTLVKTKTAFTIATSS